jgi:catechol 2,3-dioxygenase-like lactoylglutathione lyase family enzyme
MMPDYAEGVVHIALVLNVSDMDRSIAFYVDHLGFDLVKDEDDAGQDKRIVTLSFGNAVLDLVAGDPPPISKQRYRLVWEVEDLRPALQLVVAGGGRVVRQMEYGIFCADPDGNTILLTKREPEPEDLRY